MEELLSKKLDRETQIRFNNIYSELKDPLNSLYAEKVGEMVYVEGIVHKIYRPKLSPKSILFYCYSCNDKIREIQTESTIKYPEKCKCGENNFSIVSKEITDIQRVDITENSKEGEFSRIVGLAFRGDLTHRLKEIRIESKIRVFGELTFCDCGKSNSTTMDYLIDVNNFEVL